MGKKAPMAFTFTEKNYGFVLRETVKFFTYILMSFLRLTVILHENTVKSVKISLLLGNYRRNYHKLYNLRENVGNRIARYFPVILFYRKITGISIARYFPVNCTV